MSPTPIAKPPSAPTLCEYRDGRRLVATASASMRTRRAICFPLPFGGVRLVRPEERVGVYVPAMAGSCLGVLPPSQSPLARRSTIEYRGERLIGLINLYYWAMDWSVHAGHRWNLGERRSAFKLKNKELWLLGWKRLETWGSFGRDGTS